VQDALGFFERGAFGRGDEPVLRHEFAHRYAPVLDEAQVAIRQDTDELAPLDDRHSREPVTRHQVERLLDGGVGRQRHRIRDHPRLAALHLIDLAQPARPASGSCG
jgi:hypothetical protein